MVRAVFSLLAVLLGCAAAHRGGREAVARAIALAPNASASNAATASDALPAALARRGAFSLTTTVGPPAARLVSWVAPPPGRAVRGTVVLLHGVRMDKRSLVPVGSALIDAGYRAVLTDLRGHGESTGDYLTYGAREAEDVAAVLTDVGAQDDLGPVGAYGFSYGGAVALELGAVDPRVKAVVAVAAFSTLRSVVADYERKYLPGPLRLIPDAWFQGAVDEAASRAAFDPDRQSPLRAVERSSERLLLIHGTADSQVPLRHSQALAAAAGARGTLLTVPGGTHESMALDASGDVARETVAWFQRSLPL